MIPRRCGYANSWGVSGLGQFILTRIMDAHHSLCCALGFSRLLRECLAKRNLTFYDVSSIYFTPFSFHIFNGTRLVALGSAPYKCVLSSSNLPLNAHVSTSFLSSSSLH